MSQVRTRHSWKIRSPLSRSTPYARMTPWECTSEMRQWQWTPPLKRLCIFIHGGPHLVGWPNFAKKARGTGGQMSFIQSRGRDHGGWHLHGAAGKAEVLSLFLPWTAGGASSGSPFRRRVPCPRMRMRLILHRYRHGLLRLHRGNAPDARSLPRRR